MMALEPLVLHSLRHGFVPDSIKLIKRSVSHSNLSSDCLEARFAFAVFTAIIEKVLTWDEGSLHLPCPAPLLYLPNISNNASRCQGISGKKFWGQDERSIISIPYSLGESLMTMPGLSFSLLFLNGR